MSPIQRAVESVVLHALRVGGVAEIEALVARTGGSPLDLEEVLFDLENRGMVRRSIGALSGWSMTRSGRNRGEQLLAQELDAAGVRAGVSERYEVFLVFNPELLAICTDWQVRSDAVPIELNDHRDPAYDRAVLERLGALHRRACRLLADLEELLPRFGPYRARLGTALDRARSGGVDWVTRPMIDSYHTVWFELHEDFLATLGRQRSEETGR